MPESKMKKYSVGIREIHVNTIEVEAETPKEAQERAEAEAQSGTINLEYSHTMDRQYWSVDEIK